MDSENATITNTFLQDERVTSTYAEIYFNNDPQLPKGSSVKASEIENFTENEELDDEWISPSDFLIDNIKLHSPFTSKITRGITHEGILAIGNEVLVKERTTFLKSLNKLLNDNDAAWEYIINHEKKEIIEKVITIYQKIFNYKSDIMKNEMTLFYENTLQELENHLKKEVYTTLQSVYSSVISDSNIQIQHKLLKERKTLESILQKKYISEIKKVKQYYSLLLHNENYRNNKLINKAIHERNEALRTFYKQINAERITSTMYVMSLERKKCKIQKMLLENLHSTEMLHKIQNMKEKTNIIEDFRQNYVEIPIINREWEQRLKKILQLFLKFISFSLKLIPEQSSFLLCIEKMVVLQLNELQKNPHKTSSILINEELESNNFFNIEQPESNLPICDTQPFVLVGDLSDPVPKQYGSRETLPSDVDLPYFRVGRQFVYAKCHGYEHIKDILESQKCKCRIPPVLEKEPSDTSTIPLEPKSSSVQYESSLESLFPEEIEGFRDCPLRKCNKWINRYSFPELPSYLDYSEENFRRVTAILGSGHREKQAPPSPINPKSIAYRELPFSATKEPTHNIGTQYSSEEDLSIKLECPCIEKNSATEVQSRTMFGCSSADEMEKIFGKRKRSIEQLISKHPNLLKILTDESYDYKI